MGAVPTVARQIRILYQRNNDRRRASAIKPLPQTNGPLQTPSADAVAGIARRFGSLAYEGLLLTAILFICTWVFLFFAQALDSALRRPLLQIWLVGITGAYFVYCWSRSGQTLPMKTWRIHLTVAGGGQVTVPLAARRYLLALLSLGLCGLGFAWALIDRERQFLHDRIAGTRLMVKHNV
jgi:uncharacterized RDD family membrane protein YckC